MNVGTQSGKLLFVQGLRGIAALVVVAGHLRGTFYPEIATVIGESLTEMPAWIPWVGIALFGALHNGDLAIWLFWMISGLVLSIPFFRYQAESKHTRARLYVASAALRRYPRLLLPIFVSVLVACIFHTLGWMHNVSLARSLGTADSNQWLTGFYQFRASIPGCIKVAFWDAFFTYDATTTYNPVLWTVPITWFGSLLTFGFLLLIGTTPYRTIFCPALGVVLIAIGKYWMFVFVAGIALADLIVHWEDLLPKLPRLGRWIRLLRRSRIASLLTGILLIFLAGLPNHAGVTHMIVAIGIVFAAWFFIPYLSLLSMRPLLVLGRASFGIFLLHLPILFSWSCRLYLFVEPTTGKVGGILLAAVFTYTVSIILGWTLFRYADRPAAAFLKKRVGVQLRKWVVNWRGW